MPRKKKTSKKKANSPIPDMKLVADSAKPFVDDAAKTKGLVDEIEIPNHTALKFVVAATAEIKERATEINNTYKPWVDGLNEVISGIKEFFVPAENDLVEAEVILKAQIIKYVDACYTERDKLLAQVAEAHEDERTALIARGEECLPPAIPGMSIREGWNGQVTDPEAFVKWAIEHKRLDLLEPNTKALKAATKADESMRENVPGWKAELGRHVAITIDKVER